MIVVCKALITLFARSYETVSTDRQLAATRAGACVVVILCKVTGLTGANQAITTYRLGAAAGAVARVAVEDAIIA